jgi:hypothetical protein
VICPALQYFSILSHKQQYFRGKKDIEHEMFILILSTILPEIFLALGRAERDMTKNIY